MKAIVVKQFGATPQMAVEDRPMPTAGAGETLVRMHAATVNQLSNTVRTTGYGGGSAPFVLGNEGAGVVVESGRFPVGTRVAVYGAGVLGVTMDGLQQEYVAVADHRLLVLPDDFSFDEGAALTVNYITAYKALTRIGGIVPGQHVLVSGATGSLGNALVQMTIALGGNPIALVSNTAKAMRFREAYEYPVVDLSTEDLTHAVHNVVGSEGVGLAADSVGGEMVPRLLSTLRNRGTCVAIGFAGGTTAQLDLVDLIVTEKRLLGYDLHLEDDASVAEALAVVSAQASRGLLRPTIDQRIEMQEIEFGYERLASRKAVGAVVVSLSS